MPAQAAKRPRAQRECECAHSGSSTSRRSAGSAAEMVSSSLGSRCSSRSASHVVRRVPNAAQQPLAHGRQQQARPCDGRRSSGLARRAPPARADRHDPTARVARSARARRGRAGSVPGCDGSATEASPAARSTPRRSVSRRSSRDSRSTTGRSSSATVVGETVTSVTIRLVKYTGSAGPLRDRAHRLARGHGVATWEGGVAESDGTVRRHGSARRRARRAHRGLPPRTQGCTRSRVRGRRRRRGYRQDGRLRRIPVRSRRAPLLHQARARTAPLGGDPRRRAPPAARACRGSTTTASSSPTRCRPRT